MAEMSASSSFAASPYLFRDGRRMVAPYPHEFATHAKGRWIGRRVAEVLYEEFHTSAEWTPEYFASTSAAGRLTLNGRPATLEDSFKDGDRLVHVVLRVEPSVPATPIEVLLCDDQLLAVHKPAGVPVHHAGRYRKNSLIEILQSEHADLGLGGLSGNVHVLHRLDRQVSGVLLLARTAAAAAALNAAMTAGQMRKRYLARVRGLMQPGAALTVTAPILVRSAHGATTTSCDEAGKHAQSLFHCLGVDAASGTSLVLCEPITGRSHQLRLHLQRLGHPIANDPVYGTAVEGSTAAVEGSAAAVEGSAAAVEGSSAVGPSPPTKRSRVGDSAVADASSDFAAEDETACEPDVMWLHAWSYECGQTGGECGMVRPLHQTGGECGMVRPFAVCAPAPSWACLEAFGPLPSLSSLDELGAPVPLNSARGQRLLSECRGADRSAFEWLWPHFEQQRGPAMCGPASVAMVLRAVAACDGADAALRLATEALVSRAPTKEGQLTDEALAAEGQLTEEVVLNGQTVLSPHKVRSSGLTLAEMGTLLEALSVPCALTHVRGIAGAAGSDVSAEAELAAARAAMAQLRLALHGAPRAAVLVNYHMGVAGHRPFGGHFSPLAAYHEGTDRFLVLDCWPQTEPSWLASERLWSAMAATDAESRLSRGWARVGLGIE